MMKCQFRDDYGILRLLNAQPLGEEAKDLYVTVDHQKKRLPYWRLCLRHLKAMASFRYRYR